MHKRRTPGLNRYLYKAESLQGCPMPPHKRAPQQGTKYRTDEAQWFRAPWPGKRQLLRVPNIPNWTRFMTGEGRGRGTTTIPFKCATKCATKCAKKCAKKCAEKCAEKCAHYWRPLFFQENWWFLNDFGRCAAILGPPTDSENQLSGRLA